MKTLDAPKNLTRNVLLGMTLGVIIASIFFYFQAQIPVDVFLAVEKYIFNLGGQVFKNLLLLIVVPLVFFSLVSGISSLSNMVKLGSIATKTIGLYLLTTGLAVSLALFFGWVFNLSGYEGEVESYEPVQGSADLYQTVLRIFPSNIFGAFVENNMLGIVFISILFGIALNLTDDLTSGLSKAFEKMNIVFLKIVLLIMNFAPFGVFCLIGSYVMAKGLNVFGDLAQYVLILMFVLFFHLFFTYSLILKIFANLNPIIFFRKMRNVALFAFSTSSSAATIPVTLKTVSDDLGVKKDVASFVVPCWRYHKYGWNSNNAGASYNVYCEHSRSRPLSCSVWSNSFTCNGNFNWNCGSTIGRDSDSRSYLRISRFAFRCNWFNFSCRQNFRYDPNLSKCLRRCRSLMYSS